MPTLTPHGEKLRSLRVARGWTQLELALAAGVSERTVRNAEKNRPLRHDFLGFIAKALGLPLAEITRPSSELKAHRRWESHVQNLTEIFGQVTSHGDGSGILDLISPDVQLDCFGSPCDFEPMSRQFNSYVGESGVKRYLEFGQRTLDACSHVEFNIESPQGGGDIILFRSLDHYFGRSGLNFSTKTFNLVEFKHGRIARIDQFQRYVPPIE